MYAILEIAGKQFKVKENQFISAPKIKSVDITKDLSSTKDGEKDVVLFDKVLLLDDENGTVAVGSPVLKDVKVQGKIMNNNLKNDKVLVFKKKRRKGYKKMQGQRHQYSKIFIEKIIK